MTDEILKLFKDLDIVVLYVLETPFCGKVVKNKTGFKFEISQYAVITEGGYCNATSEIMNFEAKNKDLLIFDSRDCNVGALIKEMKLRDGYQVVYKKD